MANTLRKIWLKNINTLGRTFLFQAKNVDRASAENIGRGWRDTLTETIFFQRKILAERQRDILAEKYLTFSAEIFFPLRVSAENPSATVQIRKVQTLTLTLIKPKVAKKILLQNISILTLGLAI